MNAVIDLQVSREKKNSRVASYSILDMILDPQKKKEYDDYLARSYVEQDDDNIVTRYIDRFENNNDKK